MRLPVAVLPAIVQYGYHKDDKSKKRHLLDCCRLMGDRGRRAALMSAAAHGVVIIGHFDPTK